MAWYTHLITAGYKTGFMENVSSDLDSEQIDTHLLYFTIRLL